MPTDKQLRGMEKVLLMVAADLTRAPVLGQPFCSPGTYQLSPGLCIDCPIGTYSDTVGASVCNACAAGFVAIMPGSVSCTMCAVGQYSSTAGAAICSTCPIGRTTTVMGATQCIESEPITLEVVCPAGQFLSVGGQCLVCPVGTFSSFPGAISCSACMPGTAGIIEGATSCAQCAVGQYSNAAGQVHCTACPAGQTTTATGATQCTDYPMSSIPDGCTQYFDGCNTCSRDGPTDPMICTHMYCLSQLEPVCNAYALGFNPAGHRRTQQACPAGKYLSDGKCDDCPIGFYSSMPGSSSCTKCAAGYTTDFDGAVMCYAEYHNNPAPGGTTGGQNVDCCGGGSACGYFSCPALGRAYRGCVATWQLSSLGIDLADCNVPLEPECSEGDTCPLPCPLGLSGACVNGQCACTGALSTVEPECIEGDSCPLPCPLGLSGACVNGQCACATSSLH